VGPVSGQLDQLISLIQLESGHVPLKGIGLHAGNKGHVHVFLFFVFGADAPVVLRCVNWVEFFFGKKCFSQLGLNLLDYPRDGLLSRLLRLRLFGLKIGSRQLL
jgi:hypothetical protein